MWEDANIFDMAWHGMAKNILLWEDLSAGDADQGNGGEPTEPKKESPWV